MSQCLHMVYFSPAGSTCSVAEYIATDMAEKVSSWDILKHPNQAPPVCAEKDVLLLAMPVFAGRIPSVCLEGLKKLRGNGNAAIAVAVYGNRAYEDALVEMADLLTGQGFVLAAAAAVPARHSIFPVVAANRPDEADFGHLNTFREACTRKLASFDGQAVSVPGNRPYRQPGSVVIKPSGSRKCNACGLCVKLCPVHAIAPETPRKTDKSLCIACTACIAACPQKARKFHDFRYYLARLKFSRAFSARKEPEFFI